MADDYEEGEGEGDDDDRQEVLSLWFFPFDMV